MGLHLKFKAVAQKYNIFGEELPDYIHYHYKLTVDYPNNICQVLINKQQYKRSKAKELNSLLLVNMLFSRDKIKIKLAINIINNLQKC